jgi:hypothetical protein
VHRAGEGLGHGAKLAVDAVRQQVRVDRGNRDVLGERAVHGVADGRPVLTQVTAAGPAAAAVTAVQRRVDRHQRAERQVGPHVGADRRDRAGELVAGRDRVRGRRELPVHDVDVRAADPAAIHLDDDLTWPWRGIRYLRHPEAAGTVEHDGSHETSIGEAKP